MWKRITAELIYNRSIFIVYSVIMVAGLFSLILEQDVLYYVIALFLTISIFSSFWVFQKTATLQDKRDTMHLIFPISPLEIALARNLVFIIFFFLFSALLLAIIFILPGNFGNSQHLYGIISLFCILVSINALLGTTYNILFMAPGWKNLFYSVPFYLVTGTFLLLAFNVPWMLYKIRIPLSSHLWSYLYEFPGILFYIGLMLLTLTTNILVFCNRHSYK